jgi:hypothetical protein
MEHRKYKFRPGPHWAGECCRDRQQRASHLPVPRFYLRWHPRVLYAGHREQNGKIPMLYCGV